MQESRPSLNRGTYGSRHATVDPLAAGADTARSLPGSIPRICNLGEHYLLVRVPTR